MGIRVLVAYGSRLGSTREIAERIAATMVERGLTASAQPAGPQLDLSAWGAFVVGSGVYGGEWAREATDLVHSNAAALAGRPVWLFSSGPVGKLAVSHDPIDPKGIAELRAMVRARGHRVFAGALDRSNPAIESLGFAERFVTKTLIPEGDYRDWPAIEAWAGSIASELSSAAVGALAPL